MDAHRPIVMTRRGIVVAGHHMAAEAGAQVLREGGNAMDAAVSAAAVLAVAIPHMNGVGGDAFALWFDRRRGEVSVINGSGVAPGAATPAAYHARGLDRVPGRGPLSISVPGAVHAWATALERFGTIPLARALRPAVALAEEGVPLDRVVSDFLNSALYADLVRADGALGTLYGPAGARRLGESLRLPALARSLRAIADEGPGALYGGGVGASLVGDLSAAGGMLTLDDLKGHTTLLQVPLSAGYRGHRVFGAPPNTQGIAFVLLLGLLDAEDALGAVPRDESFACRFLRLKRAAFAERDRYLGDPARAAIPDDLWTPDSLAALARASALSAPTGVVSGARAPSAGGDTTSLVAMDAAGNAVSWVQSLFEEFGSGVASRSTGIVFHCRLSLASLVPGGPGTLAPGLRPPHTLCPGLFVRDGVCRIAIATPGDHGQPQTLAQVAVELLDRGRDVQAAVEAPRIRHDEGLEVMHESRHDRRGLDALAARGYHLRDVGSWSRLMGGVNAIHCPDGELRMGAADPRRASYAAAE